MTYIGVVVACMILSTPCAAQSATPDPNLTKRLESSEWTVRSDAFESLRKNSNVWTGQGMPAVLLRLLKREDDLIRTTLRESGGKVGSSDKYGEGFGEYQNDVFGACLKYCNHEDLLELMLDEARPGSEIRQDALGLMAVHAMQLFSLSQRIRVDSALISGTSDPTSFLIREAALGGLGVVIRTDTALTPERRALIQDAVIHSASDKQPWVRASVARRLGDLGGASNLALLRQMAAHDTARVISKGKVTYPVREEAERVLAKVRPPK